MVLEPERCSICSFGADNISGNYNPCTIKVQFQKCKVVHYLIFPYFFIKFSASFLVPEESNLSKILDKSCKQTNIFIKLGTSNLSDCLIAPFCIRKLIKIVPPKA